MKGLVFVVTGVLLAMVVLSVGCATKTPPAVPKAPTQNVTGILKDVNVPAEPGKDVITVETPLGLRTFAVTENTTFTLEGQACPIADVGAVLETGNATYQCILYYDDQLNAVTLNVWQSVGPLKNPN